MEHVVAHHERIPRRREESRRYRRQTRRRRRKNPGKCSQLYVRVSKKIAHGEVADVVIMRATVGGGFSFFRRAGLLYRGQPGRRRKVPDARGGGGGGAVGGVAGETLHKALVVADGGVDDSGRDGVDDDRLAVFYGLRRRRWVVGRRRDWWLPDLVGVFVDFEG